MKENRKAIFGWAMYDWANSAFATTVMASFFPIFFKEYWTVRTDPVVSTAQLGFANSTAGILVALLAPILGAMADRGKAKKGSLSSLPPSGSWRPALFYTIPRGGCETAAACYVVAMMGFSGSIIFYDSLLTTVAPEARRDSVSCGGSGGGEGGGGGGGGGGGPSRPPRSACGQRSWREALVSVRGDLVGGVLAAADPSRPGAHRHGQAPLRSSSGKAWASCATPSGRSATSRRYFSFLQPTGFYIDGVDTIIVMALDYGLSIGFRADDLIVALLITQFVGFPSALVFGWLGERIGAKQAILIGIGVYLFISIYGAFINDKREFYILACIIGAVQGGVQALSRAKPCLVTRIGGLKAWAQEAFRADETRLS